MSVNPSGKYAPVMQIRDGKVFVCECDPNGGYPWEPDYIDCPVHAEDQAQAAMERADLLAHEGEA